ncbi:unnamed protein product, partial [Rotaria magnacalcarata]
YIYVADYGNSRIVKWTANYSMGGVCVVGCTGTVGAAANQLDSPRDLKFDAAGNLRYRAAPLVASNNDNNDHDHAIILD